MSRDLETRDGQGRVDSIGRSITFSWLYIRGGDKASVINNKNPINQQQSRRSCGFCLSRRSVQFGTKMTMGFPLGWQSLGIFDEEIKENRYRLEWLISPGGAGEWVTREGPVRRRRVLGGSWKGAKALSRYFLTSHHLLPNFHLGYWISDQSCLGIPRVGRYDKYLCTYANGQTNGRSW